MKKLAWVVLIAVGGFLASCQKKQEPKPQAPLHVLIGFKNDISSAD